MPTANSRFIGCAPPAASRGASMGSAPTPRHLTLAAKGNRLLYSTVSINFDIHRARPEPRPTQNRSDSSPRRATKARPRTHPTASESRFRLTAAACAQIWIADADGSNPAPLTSFADGVAGSPKWSPDGQLIVFDARAGGNTDIYTVPAGGWPRQTAHRLPGAGSSFPPGRLTASGSISARTRAGAPRDFPHAAGWQRGPADHAQRRLITAWSLRTANGYTTRCL